MKAGNGYIPQVYTSNLNNKGNHKRKNLPKVKTKREEKKARKLYYKSHARIIDGKTKFSDYCFCWLENHIWGADSTKATYSMIIRKHLIPFFGSMKLASIKKYEIDNFIKNMVVEKYSSHYTNLMINIMRKLFNDACKNGFIPFPPTKAIESFKYRKKNVVIPDLKQCSMIAGILRKADRYRFPLLFGWYAGLRRGEALGIQWGDIDFKKNIITISRQITQDMNNPKPPKRDEKRRIALAPALRVELLKVPSEERIPNKYIYRNIRSSDPKALDYYFKKHISPKIKDILGMNKAERFVFHDFRHINLTKLLSLPEVPINTIREYAGHKSIETTTQIYGQRAPDEMDTIREALGKALS